MLKKIIPCLMFIALIAACGYKGALYLPKPTPAPGLKPVAESSMMIESYGIESAESSVKLAESMVKANESSVKHTPESE
jgi:predicted small lipoprotein YifL